MPISNVVTVFYSDKCFTIFTVYRLQQEAPKPFCVACQREVSCDFVSHCGCLCVCTAFAHFAKDSQVVITSVLGQDTAMWRESINERRMEKGKCVCASS